MQRPYLALPLGHPPGIEFLIKRAPLIGQLAVWINEFIGKSCYPAHVNAL